MTYQIKPTKVKTFKESKLNNNQLIFVAELLADKGFNPTEAARKAGYKNPSQAANALLKNQLVHAAIGKAVYDRSQELHLSAEMVLKELMCIGFFNPKKMLNGQGQVMDLKDLPDEVAAAIQSFRITYTDEVEEGVFSRVKHVDIKFWDKPAALQLLAKHLGILQDKLIVDQRMQIDWNLLCLPPDNALDAVERKILDVESRATTVKAQ